MLDEYITHFAQADAYGRMFFVWHTGNLAEDIAPMNVTVLGPRKLSRMVLDSGLSSWLREKVS